MFDGQSLNNVPSASNMPSLTMAGRTTPWRNVATTAWSWTQLAANAASRRDPVLQNAGRTLLVLTGGLSDILLEGNTAAQVLADMEAYAASARAAGADRIIGSTIAPSTALSAPQDAIRLAANALILASTAWEAAVDIVADSRLQNPANTTYYSDGSHWTAAGAEIATAALSPVVTAQIAAL